MLLALLPGTVQASVELSVEVEGDSLDAAYRDNIRRYLRIERQQDSEILSVSQLRRLHRLADKDIRAALEPFGYYNPIIDSSLVREDDERWRASYRIELGKPLTITTLQFQLTGQAEKDPAYAELVTASLPQLNSPFSHVGYDDFKAALIGLANERGYFQANFLQQRVEINRSKNSAAIYLEYDSGPRYRFGDLLIVQGVLDEQLVRRFAPFSEGDFYELDLLIEYQQALNDTRYFNSVEVSAGQTAEGSTEVPVNVRLTPRSQHLYKLGLGYGTDTGARALFGWEVPRVNSRGHHFDSELRVSEINYELSATYRIPVLNPRTDQLSFSAAEEGERFETGLSVKRSLGASLAQGRGGWRETLSIEYEIEDFEIDNNQFDSELLIPGVSWSRIWGSGLISVLQGIRLDLSIRAANRAVISDTDLSKYQAAIKFITPLGPRDRIIMRGALGTIETADFDRIPSSLRFYAGGATSVRGYAYQSLGPEDDDGDSIGASKLMVGSIEYEHFFSDRWGMAVFLDGGNAFDDFDKSLEQGAGFGFRWKSPVGLIRLDFASAITDGQDWRLHLNIGPDL